MKSTSKPALEPVRPSRNGPVSFTGRTIADAKRKALNYWYVHHATLKLGIKEFSACLSLQPDGHTITFTPRRSSDD